MVPWIWVAPALTAAMALATAEFAIVVGVDAEGRAGDAGFHRVADLHDFGRQRAAVGVAEHEAGGAAFRRGFEGGQRVLGRVLVAVEKMLGVIHHLAAVFHQMGHRVADHRAVFLHRGAQDFGDLHFPAFAENRDHRRLRFEQQAHLGVVLHRHIGAAGGTEGGELGVFELRGFSPRGKTPRPSGWSPASRLRCSRCRRRRAAGRCAVCRGRKAGSLRPACRRAGSCRREIQVWRSSLGARRLEGERRLGKGEAKSAQENFAETPAPQAAAPGA